MIKCKRIYLCDRMFWVLGNEWNKEIVPFFYLLCDDIRICIGKSDIYQTLAWLDLWLAW